MEHPMPFDSNGNFSLAPSYLAVTGQTILASQHNPPLEDIASGLSVTLLRTGVAPMIANLPMGGFRITGLASGIASTDAVNKGQMDAAASPVGTVADFAGVAAPSGWLLCYGQAISRTTYAALFAVIGVTYGIGDGSTTFNIPDCRGRVSAGKDDMGGASANRLTSATGGVDGDVLGNVGGLETHALTLAQLAAHTHTGTIAPSGAHTHDISFNGSFGSNSGFYPTNPHWSWGDIITGLTTATTVSGGTHTHTFTSDSTGSGTGHNNVQPSIIFNKIIRTGV
jgi:microcystin-dependent protein